MLRSELVVVKADGVLSRPRAVEAAGSAPLAAASSVDNPAFQLAHRTSCQLHAPPFRQPFAGRPRAGSADFILDLGGDDCHIEVSEALELGGAL